jgi:sugar lactone lactonase YvrE
MKTKFLLVFAAFQFLAGYTLIYGQQGVSTLTTGHLAINATAVDQEGNYYFAQRHPMNQIKKRDINGNVTVYCDQGLNDPTNIVIDNQGFMYVTNHGYSMYPILMDIAVIPPGGGIATSYATGIYSPWGLDIAEDGTLYVGEYFSQKVYKIAPGGGAVGTPQVEEIVGEFAINNGNRLYGIGIDQEENVYISLDNGNVYKYDAVTSSLSSFASGMLYPTDVRYNSFDNHLYVADFGFNRIYRITLDGVVNAHTGTGVTSSVDGTLSTASFSLPINLSVDGNGNLLVADNGSGQLRLVTGCHANVEINMNQPFLCEGYSAEFDVEITYGNGTLTYSWAGPNDFESTDANPTVGPLTSLFNGTYELTITDELGCTKEASFQLAVNATQQGTDVQSACGSFTWIDNITYTESTHTPTYVIPNGAANGCDSIVTLNLTILNPATGIDVQESCESYLWIDGNTYSASTTTPTFLIAGGAANGCDSIATLHLTILEPSTGIDHQTACASYLWIDGQTYTESTNLPTYTLVGGAATGCDSIVTLNLIITGPSYGTDVVTACASYEWIDGNTYTSSTNTPVYTLVGGAENGCDSIVTLNLTIHAYPNNEVTVFENVLTASDENSTYQWVDCANSFEPILNADDQSFAPVANGSYAVILENNGCEVTSDCFAITTLSIQYMNQKHALSIYPNPSSGNFTISGLSDEHSSFALFSFAGQILMTGDLSDSNQIDLSGFENGTYILIVNNESHKLVKH